MKSISDLSPGDRGNYDYNIPIFELGFHTRPNGKLMLGMLAVFADFERDTIRERLESGKNYARIKGTKSGLPMHRPQIEIPWKQVDDLLSKYISIPSIAKIIGVSKKTMYDRIKTRNTSKS